MYATCIFCCKPLGRNAVLGSFPVGRRLSFDATRGRLWVVCPHCSGWNLTPLQERWEAVEECTERFEVAKDRFIHGQIGVADLPEGVQLIRVGNAGWSEVAFWRYGGRLRTRRMGGLLVGLGLWTGAAGVGTLGWLIGGPVGLALAAACSGLLVPGIQGVLAHDRALQQAKTVLMRLPDRSPEEWNEPHRIDQARIRPGGGDCGWELHLRVSSGGGRAGGPFREQTWVLEGSTAVRVLAILTAAFNQKLGTKRHVTGALKELERVGRLADYAAIAEQQARARGKGHRELWQMPTDIRLALEMAANEERERRALEGELAELEQQWREAEEVAAIADRLLTPADVEERLAEMRDARR